MFGFGDEVIIKSCNIPWLIWIQLLAMLLLLILLYYSTTFTPSHLFLHLSTATTSPSATASAINPRHNSKVRENEIKETRTRASTSTSTSTSEVVQRAADRPDARQRAESSTTNERSSEHSHHPCHIFGRAKKAVLKCLGIDSTPDRHHEKND